MLVWFSEERDLARRKESERKNKSLRVYAKRVHRELREEEEGES